MKRMGQIFVMLVAIVALLSPAPALCASHHPADHSCCASQPELSTSCCQSDAAPRPAMPKTPAGNQCFGNRISLHVPDDWMTMPEPINWVAAFSANPPMHLPATILRT
jgi:hypothetical protein